MIITQTKRRLKNLHKPIIENDNINFDNIFFFAKYIIKNYSRVTFYLLVIFFLYKFLQTPTYSSSISFYTNYEKSNQIPSSLGFISSLAGVKKDNNLGFSVSDYINSEGFAKDILDKQYIIEGEKIKLSDYFGKSYDKMFSINPLSIISKINRNLMLADNLTDEDRKFLYAKESLIQSIKYTENSDTSLHKITISVSGLPLLSKQIAESAFNSIIDYSTRVTNIKGEEKRKFIESRLKAIKSDLENAEDEMQKFRENNKDLNSPALILKGDRIERNIILYSQLYLSLSDQLEIAKIDEKDSTSSVFLLDSATISSYKDGRSLLENIILMCISVFILVTGYEIYINRKKLFL